MSSKGHVWFSFGSDKSGPALAEALGFSSGKKTPDPERYEVLIGWGCKLGESYDRAKFRKAVASGKLRILNAAEAVEANRNKLETLKKMAAAGVMTPGFLERNGLEPNAIVAAVRGGQIALPLLGLTETNSGSPHFFYTMEDLAQAPASISYFRSFTPGTEYRVHVIRDMVLLAQKKVLSEDPERAIAVNLYERLSKRATKENEETAKAMCNTLSPAQLQIVIKELAPDLLTNPSQIQRSTSRGWELKDVELKTVPEKVQEEAVRALDAVGLDLGAVSVVLDEENPHGRAAVTAITTAPSLSEKHLTIYTQALRDFATSTENRENKPEKRDVVRKAPAELLATLTGKVAELDEREARRLLAYFEAS